MVDIFKPNMLFLTFIVTLFPATLAVKCYICSWSPNDAPNRTVMCSDGHFDPNAVNSILDCEKGCETYVHYDSNGVVEQVRRNCLQPETELTRDCRKVENIAFSSKRCTCDYNLCNSTPAFVPLPLMSLLFIAMAGLWRLHFF